MSAAQLSSTWGPYPPPSAARLEDVTQRLAAVTRRISEQPSPHPRLVAVSKLQEPSAVLAAHRGPAGHSHFGENYAQELRDKSRVLPRSIQWHYVGQMQTSKAKMLAAIPNLYLVETLDSEKAADALDKALANRDASAPLRVYLQVNTSGEESKAGLPPLHEANDGPLLELAQHVIQSCPHLLLQGLMTIGSRAASSGASNPDFDCLVASRRALVAALRSAAPKPARDGYEALLQQGDDDGGLELSMGMSADLEAAIRAGSSNVRVGTDCFGERAGTRDEAMEAMKHELEWDVDAKRKELGLSEDE